MPKVFISYARDGGAGEVLAAEVQTQLQQQNFEVFRDVIGLKPGDVWYHKLESELESSDFVVLVVSEKVRTSKWVHNEVFMAEEIGLPVVPVLAERIRLPLWLRHLQTLDFCGERDWAQLFEVLGVPLEHLDSKREFLEKNPEKTIKKTDGGITYRQPPLTFDDIEARTIQAFISYSRKDADYLDEFFAHMSPLVRSNNLTAWYDKAIDLGSPWEPEIFERLEQSSLMICLVSHNFIASDFCYEKEFLQALSDHKSGKKIIVPILLRSCYWDELPLAKLQGAPEKWITSYPNRDEAWTDVVRRIAALVKKVKKL